VKLLICTIQLALLTASTLAGGTMPTSASPSVPRVKSTKLVLHPVSGHARIRVDRTRLSVISDVSGDVTVQLDTSTTLQRMVYVSQRVSVLVSTTKRNTNQAR